MASGLPLTKISNMIAALFILIFVYTATSKLLDMERFHGALGASPLIGGYADVLVWAVPGIELLVSGFLFFPALRHAGLILSLFIMLAFTGYIGYILTFSSKLPCSCGGVIEKLSWKGHLVFNILLTVLAVFALTADKIFIAINRESRKPVERVGKIYSFIKFKK